MVYFNEVQVTVLEGLENNRFAGRSGRQTGADQVCKEAVMLKVPIEVPPEIYELIKVFMETGVVEQDGKSVDFSTVQTITITDGRVTLDPPAKVAAKVGPMNIKTTITTMKVRKGGIKINIDNSPIDVEVRPHE